MLGNTPISLATQREYSGNQLVGHQLTILNRSTSFAPARLKSLPSWSGCSYRHLTATVLVVTVTVD